MFMSRRGDCTGMTSSKKGKNTTGAKKSGGGVNWTRAAMVILGVGFVVVMIVTSLGTGWLVGMKPAQSGDVAVIGLTIRDEMGQPVLTTEQRIYEEYSQQGAFVEMANPLQLRVNGTTTNLIEKIPVYHFSFGNGNFGLYGPELNEISSNLAGMKDGETKRIAFGEISGLQYNVTEEQFNSFGGNFSTVQIGDQLGLAVMESPILNTDENTTPVVPVRIGRITEKGENNVVIDLQYSTADVTIKQLSRAS